jgi:hypothetical protein
MTAMIAIAAHKAPITDACASSLGRSDRAWPNPLIKQTSVSFR